MLNLLNPSALVEWNPQLNRVRAFVHERALASAKATISLGTPPMQANLRHTVAVLPLQLAPLQLQLFYASFAMDM